ncbi:enoyl-CoA hydratase-related protein [Leptospira sp. GIMC2001]|uniref:enoyl-CoA hydratase-related protein n=1 Tax=Leptospira sp. GIMC2001 TaxID=1513297 RepID=UPI00234BFCCA|nr:enoyl-CoA hydratase-related protein [Leptospira sp. GIMC2001]WCL50115.1 enoyl-CoA hydratase-related protein [Leptospira sp. GIMC2001]
MKLIDYTEGKGIGILRLQSPATRNAISRELLRQLDIIIRELDLSKPKDQPRVLIITGEGNTAFCAGADLKERATMTEAEVWSFLGKFREFLANIERLPFPTIAGINGVALGGGLEIALACDLRAISTSALIGLPETKLGIIPGAGGTQRLSRLIGANRAKEIIFTGRKISATEANLLGLVNRVLPEENFAETLLSFAEEISSSAPISLRAAKRAIQEGLNLDLEKGLDLEQECYSLTLKTKDREEALLAFREKRKPVFRGE